MFTFTSKPLFIFLVHAYIKVELLILFSSVKEKVSICSLYHFDFQFSSPEQLLLLINFESWDKELESLKHKIHLTFML